MMRRPVSATTTPGPSCRRPAPPRAENAEFPFCSARCRAVDLGRWLTEAYRIPTTAPELEEDEAPVVADPDGDG